MPPSATSDSPYVRNDLGQVAQGHATRSEHLLQLFDLLEVAPFSSARILVTTVSHSLRARGVVTTSYLLDPSPGVSGRLHNLAGSLAFTDEPEDLVVAA
jgi:hypothetical protein